MSDVSCPGRMGGSGMNKPFLLMTGLFVNPKSIQRIGRYATREEAKESAAALIRDIEGVYNPAEEWGYDDKRWIEIVDLRTWGQAGLVDKD